jgi:asparagine synthetase B (glutamine-hydrolysing)
MVEVMNSPHPWVQLLDTVPHHPGISDPVEAAIALEDVVDRTARALDPPGVVLLSGGIDSMLVALAAVRSDLSPSCVTVTTDIEDRSLDGYWARATAAYLGLDWEPVLVRETEVRRLVERAARQLGGRGLYQIGRCITDLAIADACQARGLSVAWSGTGADLLFDTFPDPADPDGPVRLDWEGRRAMLLRARTPTPENPYFDKQTVLEDAGISVSPFFETTECLALAARLEPSALIAGPAVAGDAAGPSKLPLRILAERWGLPRQLAYQPKRALQDSSGVFALLAECARHDELSICDDFTSQAPTRHGRDPAIMTAYWLQLVDTGRVSSRGISRRMV